MKKEKKGLIIKQRALFLWIWEPVLLYNDNDNGEVCLFKNFPFSGMTFLDSYRPIFGSWTDIYDRSYYFVTQYATTASEKQQRG